YRPARNSAGSSSGQAHPGTRARCPACDASVGGPGTALFSPSAGACECLVSDSLRFVSILPDTVLAQRKEHLSGADELKMLPLRCFGSSFSANATKCGTICLSQESACALGIVLLLLWGNDSPRRYPAMRLTSNHFRVWFCFLIGLASCVSARASDRATILYDAFGNAENLKKDWGFSVLIEYSGKKILFDTGNNAKTFAANVKAMHVDLKELDFVVISHRHGDHTSGLNYLLQVNPRVKIYAPAEMFGVFGSTVPKGLYKSVDTL